MGVFAIDSVTAKVAMVSQFDDRIDLVLNFTSSAFTMLTLRSLYFLIASLVPMFRFMKYGVGIILILIGFRLMFSRLIEISEIGFCAMMIAVFGISIFASVLWSPMPDSNSGGGGEHLSAGALAA